MIKILRKYNKFILVFFGVFLMIAFLVPSTGGGGGGRDKGEVVARLGEEKVYFRDWMLAEARFKALESFSPLVARGVLGVENGTHWFLLAHEAKAAGFVGGPEDGANWIPELVDEITVMQIRERFGQLASFILTNPAGSQIVLETQNAVAANLEQLRINAINNLARVGLGSQDFDQTLAEARGIFRMIQSFEQAPRFSSTRLLNQSSLRHDSAFVDLLLIPSSRLAAESPEPTEAELAAHFEKHREVQPGTGEYGFGYRQPPRVKIEYLTLDRPAILNSITLDPVEVNTFYRRNHPAKYPAEFGAERARVEQDMRDEQADRVLAEADRLIRLEVNRATRRLADDQGYKVLPENWTEQRPKFEQLAQSVVAGVRERLQLSIPLPEVTIKDSAWLRPSDLAGLPGIGRASFQVAGQPAPFHQAVFLVRELGIPNDWAMQVGVPFVDKLLVDQNRSRYYVTVTAVKPEGPAETIDEVRDDVVRDLKTLHAYNRLLAEADSLRALAIAEGLDTVAAKFSPPIPEGAEPTPETEPLKPFSLVQVTREAVADRAQSAQLATANVPAFREAVMASAVSISPFDPPLRGSEARGDAAANRVLTVPLPKTGVLAVAQIIANRPLTEEQFRASAEFDAQNFRREALIAELSEVRENPFSYRALRERLYYRPVRPDITDETPDSPQS